MRIRNEIPEDFAAIHAVNSAAFARPEEGNLVNALRDRVAPFISLVAEHEGVLVGHILFTPVTLTDFPEMKLMGLGPVAVEPSQQRRGIGAALILAGLERCREQGVGAVVLLGHPEYYPRFGFRRAAEFGIRCEFGPCDDSFMVIEIDPGYLRGAYGLAKYHEAFSSV